MSPLLRARPGSLHGYDVVDHGALNPELGTRADFDRLVELLHARGMGLLVDIVPNHMGVLGNDNAWWLDVLENGQASAYAEHFDIDWAVPDPALRGKVLLPILGDQYGIVLERGELRLGFDADARRVSPSTTSSTACRSTRQPFGPLLMRAMRRLPGDDAHRAGAAVAGERAVAACRRTMRASAAARAQAPRRAARRCAGAWPSWRRGRPRCAQCIESLSRRAERPASASARASTRWTR